MTYQQVFLMHYRVFVVCDGRALGPRCQRAAGQYRHGTPTQRLMQSTGKDRTMASSTTWQTAGLFRFGRAFTSVVIAFTATIFNLPTAAFVNAVKWQKRAEMRHRLAEMDDRLLADMGITRRDATREAEKPFWVS